MAKSQRTPLWASTKSDQEDSGLLRYWRSQQTEGVTSDAPAYQEIWEWSIADLPRFWHSLFPYFEIEYQGQQPSPQTALAGDIENPVWFAGTKLNYAYHVLRQLSPGKTALVTVNEQQEVRQITGDEVLREVSRLRAIMIDAGLQKGDAVAAFVPNTEHAIYGFLAATSLGAIWSSCSPDFGADAVLDRFEQLSPKLLIACTSYQYGGKKIDRVSTVEELRAGLSSVEHAIQIRLQETDVTLTDWIDWHKQPDVSHVFSIEDCEFVPFDAPLWALFSSGTTGQPKAIVHSHGGCLLEHLKYLEFQLDVKPEEHFFWFTTTGWMMWNVLQASMLVKAIPVLYDGSPGYPSLDSLWELASSLPIHHFGTSAPFIHACMAGGLDVAASYDLRSLRSIGSTGAPLSPEGFQYVYDKISPRVWLASMSGGTDVCTAFVGGNILSPVYEGVIQGRALGCPLYAYDEDGNSVTGEVGEMVITAPMPSMPIYFLNDEDGSRRHNSYFSSFPNTWRHGDWITIDNEGGIVIHGRSDATLNRQGVRIGTAEIYRVVQQLAEIEDSLIINYQTDDGRDEMPLFVKLSEDQLLTPDLVQRVNSALRQKNSPRHVPTRVEAVADIPYTISGKKLEAPVKKLFLGKPLESVAKLGALRNPEALQAFADLAKKEHRS